MGIKTIMVHLELEKPRGSLLALTGELALKLSAAEVIGIAGCQPVELIYGDTYVAGEVMAADRKQIEHDLKVVEERFTSALTGKVDRLEWRSNITYGPLADYIAREARAADLLITGPEIGGSMFDHARRTRIADLVLEVGRPVLIVPDTCDKLDLGHVLIGWKDSPECRRATLAAVPFFKLAGRVSVLAITSQASQKEIEGEVEDVVGWLSRHGVTATGEVAQKKGEDAACFHKLVKEKSPGLVVAGAYAHSRLREWALGGVTGDVLLRPDRPVLLFH